MEKVAKERQSNIWQIWFLPVEEENIPGPGLHHDGFPKDLDDSLQSLRVHRGQVPGPSMAQPAQVVRAGDDLETAILPG